MNSRKQNLFKHCASGKDLIMIKKKYCYCNIFSVPYLCTGIVHETRGLHHDRSNLLQRKNQTRNFIKD